MSGMNGRPTSSSRGRLLSLAFGVYAAGAASLTYACGSGSDKPTHDIPVGDDGGGGVDGAEDVLADASGDGTSQDMDGAQDTVVQDVPLDWHPDYTPRPEDASMDVDMDSNPIYGSDHQIPFDGFPPPG
jgi:hypothetical protein